MGITWTEVTYCNFVLLIDTLFDARRKLSDIFAPGDQPTAPIDATPCRRILDLHALTKATNVTRVYVMMSG